MISTHVARATATVVASDSYRRSSVRVCIAIAPSTRAAVEDQAKATKLRAPSACVLPPRTSEAVPLSRFRVRARGES